VLVPDGEKLPVKQTAVLVFRLRHIDDAPHSSFPGSVAAELVEKRLRIQAIRLHLASSAISVNTRGIDHQVCCAGGGQRAMQPEAIASSLIATHYRGLVMQAEAPFRGSYLVLQAPKISRWHRTYSGWGARTSNRKAELPLLIAEIEGEE